VNKMLIGNKCDMVDKKVIDTARGKALAEEYSIKFLETSAKTGAGVEDAFITLAKDIKKRLIDPSVTEGTEGHKEGTLDFNNSSNDPAGKKKKECCSS